MAYHRVSQTKSIAIPHQPVCLADVFFSFSFLKMFSKAITDYTILKQGVSVEANDK